MSRLRSALTRTRILKYFDVFCICFLIKLKLILERQIGVKLINNINKDIKNNQWKISPHRMIFRVGLQRLTCLTLHRNDQASGVLSLLRGVDDGDLKRDCVFRLDWVCRRAAIFFDVMFESFLLSSVSIDRSRTQTHYKCWWNN